MRMGCYAPWSDWALGAFVWGILMIVHGAEALTTPMQYQQHHYPAAAQTVFASGQFGVGAAQFNYSEWDFAQGPAPNATGHLVFDTVRSLLQHWPNTRYRNGHTIVPGTIPPGTLLYHGTYRPVVPAIPEWTATDPEHSYLFCRNPPLPSPDSPSPPAEGCWHLTLAATRSLRVLYFDGSSAAKMRDGPMDTQDLVAWGRIWEEKMFAERERLAALCKWGEGRGIDGFVRMEMDFEVMLCDFTAGVEVVSFLNIVPIVRQRMPRRSDPPRPPSPLGNGAIPRLDPHVGPDTRVLEAGSWHNVYPGETRIVLDYARLISFYDTALFPGLAQTRVGVPRLKNNLGQIDEEDRNSFKERLEEVTVRDGGQDGSGVDWRTLFQAIAERYADRLERLPYILNVTAAHSEAEVRNRSAQAHRALSSMLAPYILQTAVPPSSNSSRTGSAESIASTQNAHPWAAPVWAQCAAAHTNAVARLALAARMSAAEELLLGAAREVEREICRVLVGVWAEGRELGLRGWEDPDDDDDVGVNADKVSYARLVTDWRQRIEGLMRWLDWSVDWLKCRPACSFEEMCYLPTWPFFSRPPPRGPRNVTLANDLEGEEPENDWEDPQPTCIRIIEPFGGYEDEEI